MVIPAAMRERGRLSPGSELEDHRRRTGVSGWCASPQDRASVKSARGWLPARRGGALTAAPIVDIAAAIEEERNRWP